MPGTVLQRAHRDFKLKTHNEQFPGQVYIGFMPITRDGMFLQVWNGPGESKLGFVLHYAPWSKRLFVLKILLCCTDLCLIVEGAQGNY
jgi:hypothetical protein